jgi:transposase-like protein
VGRPAKYPPEFRREAIALVKSSGRPVAEVARSLSIAEGTLWNWVKADREQAERAADPNALSESERAELQRLRKERSADDGHGDPVKGRRVSREGDEPVSGFRFVDEHQADYPVTDLCRVTVVAALVMALGRRNPSHDTIHHADHGTQYTSLEFTNRLHDWGLVGSYGSVGDCYDNAAMEPVWATIKTEIQHIWGPIDQRPDPRCAPSCSTTSRPSTTAGDTKPASTTAPPPRPTQPPWQADPPKPRVHQTGATPPRQPALSTAGTARYRWLFG